MNLMAFFFFALDQALRLYPGCAWGLRWGWCMMDDGMRLFYEMCSYVHPC